MTPLEKCGICPRWPKPGRNSTMMVRTRIYVLDISCWEDVARAHREFFRRPIRPLPQLWLNCFRASKFTPEGCGENWRVDGLIDG